ncbi:MAG: MFS transporter [Pseudomonadota bacterium]
MFASILRAYKGIPGSIWSLLFIQFLMNAGHFMAIPLLAVHLNSNLQLGASALGTVLTVHLLSARLLPGISGPLVDYMGPRGLMIIGLLCRAFGLIGVVFLDFFWGLCFMAFLMGAGTSLYESSVYGVFGRQSKALTARVFVLNNQALNAGVVLGPVIGSALALFSTDYAFLSSGLVFGALTLWVLRLRFDEKLDFKNVPVLQSIRTVVADRTFLVFFVATLPWWFLFTQLYVVFPIYITDISGSIAYTGSLYVVNGIVGLAAMFFSIVIFEKVPSRKIMRWSYLALAVIYLMVPLSNFVWWFLVVVGLYTIAETFILPAIETVTAELATSGSQSTYFGAASLAWALSGSIGNYLGSWLVLEADSTAMWWVFSGVAFVGLAFSLCLGRQKVQAKLA